MAGGAEALGRPRSGRRARGCRRRPGADPSEVEANSGGAGAGVAAVGVGGELGGGRCWGAALELGDETLVSVEVEVDESGSEGITMRSSQFDRDADLGPHGNRPSSHRLGPRCPFSSFPLPLSIKLIYSCNINTIIPHPQGTGDVHPRH